MSALTRGISFTSGDCPSFIEGDRIMVIDKKTGKGCAWSIASKTITKRLIAEGIIGKPFARKQTRRRDCLLSAEKFSGGQVYIT